MNSGGGNTESLFKNAPSGTIKNLIWADQMGRDERFRGPDIQVFRDFTRDPDGVMYTTIFKMLTHMSHHLETCNVKIKQVTRWRQ